MEEDRPIFDWSLDKETRINLETGMNLLEAKHEISLKNCIIEAFVMVCNLPLGRPLLVKNFFFTSNDDTITCYVLAHLQELFENLLQVEIANLGFYSRIMQEIFNNPSLLEVSSLPMVVNVRCGYCWSEEVHPSFIKSVYRADLIMNLIQNIKLSDREYTFRLCYVEPGFQRKFKENFKQAELQRLPKKFSLKYYGNGGIVNIEVNDDDVKSINISHYRQ
uniref:Uncharacterized protein n=1 Tax=Acrobeloides nanus TaxID=290746 RepID=A0A914D3H2_9BILA